MGRVGKWARVIVFMSAVFSVSVMIWLVPIRSLLCLCLWLPVWVWDARAWLVVLLLVIGAALAFPDLKEEDEE